VNQRRQNPNAKLIKEKKKTQTHGSSS